MLRCLFLICFLVAATSWVPAQNCPDTSPKITGPGIVGANPSNPVTYETPGVTGHTYSWQILELPGNTLVNSSTSNMISQTWSTPGQYLIKLSEGISGNPCTAVQAASMTVTVRPMLAAYFYYEFDVNHGCFYNVVDFTGTGDGQFPPSDPSITYDWKWREYNSGNAWTPGGTTPAGKNTQITFPTVSGKTYEVEYTVSKLIGTTAWTDAITDYVYVDPDKYKPVAVIAAPVAPNCTYGDFSFDASGSIATFVPTSETFRYVDWDFGDGQSAHYAMSGSIPPQMTTTHAYPTNAGASFTVTLRLENTIGCVTTKSINITVPNSIPVAQFSNNPGCVGEPTIFNDLSLAAPEGGSIVKWEWMWGDNTTTVYGPGAVPPSPVPNPISHLYASAGSKVVKLQVTNANGCVSSYYTLNVNVIPSPIAEFEYGVSCVDIPMNFLDKSLQNGGSNIVSRLWDYGDGNLTTNASYTFTTPGLKTVTLTVTNENGCSDYKVDNTIFVHPLPQFSPNPTQGFTWANTALPLEIQFTDNTIPAQVGNNIQWNFGDGHIGFGKNPVHAYANPGTFSVEMTCTSIDGCTRNYTDLISFTPPVPTFHAIPYDACLNKEVRFEPDPISGIIVSQEWQYQDEGYPVNPALPSPYTISHKFIPPTSLPAADTHSFKSYGTKAVRHIITLQGTPNIVVDYVDYVTIHDTAVANYTWNNINVLPVGGPPLPGCKGQEVFFFDQSTPPLGSANAQIVAWKWEFDDPASSLNNVAYTKNCSHIFMDPIRTTFRVKLTVTSSDNNCESIIIKTITIKASPPVNFIVNNNPSANVGCLSTPALPVTTNFAYDPAIIPDPTLIANWLWEFGDNTSQSGPFLSTIGHAYLTPGWKTVLLTITDRDGCRNTVSKQVYINPLPIADFYFTTNTCEGQAVQFTDQSQPGGGLLNDYIVQWEWFWNDGTLPNPQVVTNNATIFHTFPIVTGQYTWSVRLRVTTNYGCVQEVTKQVTLKPSPVAFFEVQPLTPLCMTPQSVQFQDKTVPTAATGPVTNWSWDFGDGGTSTLQNPQHIFMLAASYTVSLTVTTSNGCSSSYISVPPIIINQLPIANFGLTATQTTSPLQSCAETDIQFFDWSDPKAVPFNLIYNWNFGDGGTSTAQNPFHTYASYGYKNVTLTITNVNGCTHSVTKTVLINPKPVAAFSYQPSTSCVDQEMTFIDESYIPTGFPGSINQWRWQWGDGSPDDIIYGSSGNTTHTFDPTTGVVHTVILTVTTSVAPTGCIASITKTITSVPRPIADFTHSGATCVNQPVQFTSLSSENGGGPITYLWEFEDGPGGPVSYATVENPVHTFPTAATGLQVKLTVTNANGCQHTTQQGIDINAAPEANFTYNQVCQGMPTAFTETTTNVASRVWAFGDGQTSVQQNPLHIYANPGTYLVTLTVTDVNGCIDDITMQVVVLAKPVAEFSYSAPNCAGSEVNFYNQCPPPAGGYITEWRWLFGDGTPELIVPFGSNPDVKHIYVAGGTYTVKLTIVTSTGCQAEQSHTLTIENKPMANFLVAPNPCSKTPVQFTDNSQLNGGSALVSWSWNFADPASGANNTSIVQNPLHTFSGAGIFNVQLEVHNATGCIGTYSGTVDVKAAPSAMFTATTACVGNMTSFFDNSSTATSTTIVSWNWDFGDPSSGTNNISTLQNPTHTYQALNTYFVTLSVTNSNQCVKDTVLPVVVNPKPQAMFQYTPACINGPTQFNDLSIAPGSAIQSWLWDFGCGTAACTSTLQNPQYTFTSPGTYNVRLKVTNLSGCVDSVIIPVVARPVPTAKFTYSSFFCPAGKVNFQDISLAPASAIVNRQWIFEPGSTSSLPNPSYTFPATSTVTSYPVTLIVTDTYGCRDTVLDSLVYVKPAFDFSFSYQMVCEGKPTPFVPLNLTPGDSLYSVSWNFGDPASGQNNTSILYRPTHIFTRPGTFYVKMKAFNSDNCVDSIFKEVVVYAAPKPLFTSISPQCTDTIYFTDATVDPGTGTIAEWKWIWGDAQPPLIYNTPINPVVHTYAIGTYSVTLAITNTNGCVDSTVRSVTKLPCISAVYSVTSVGSLCAGTEVSFSDLSYPDNLISSWNWSWGDGNSTAYTTFTPIIKHTYTAGGTYTVTLVVSAQPNGTTITSTMVQQVIIRPTPVANFANSAVCLQLPSVFRDSSQTFGEKNVTWLWEFGTGTSSVTASGETVSYVFDSAGYHNVQLIIANRFGCGDTITKRTRIYHLPKADFENTAACVGDTTYFTDLTLEGDTIITQWRWSFGYPAAYPDISFRQNTGYRYPETGDYNIGLIVQDRFGCKDTVEASIRVNVAPMAAFTIIKGYNGKQGQVKLNNLSQDGKSYLWDFDNGKTSTEQNPVATYTDDGTYRIKLITTNEFDCTDTTFFDYELLLKGLFVPNAFAPTSTDLGVRLFQPIGINLKQGYYHVMVFDMWGHMLWESNKLDDKGRPVEGWDGTYQGNLMPQGNYMWKISATFVDDTPWNGSDIGQGEYKTMGNVTLIR